MWTGRVACLVSLGRNFAPGLPFWGGRVEECPGVANSMPVMQCTIEGSDHPVGGPDSFVLDDTFIIHADLDRVGWSSLRQALQK